jgi:pimeloyl-ACP methyl ester carboxylesterase
MPTLRANGIDIYYELHGAGEPLLLIMGLGANATAWWKQVPEFSKHYQVIAFDNRGAGRTEKPNEPYTIMQMADDADALMEELGIQSAHVFGMSLGGMIAQELALRHPERVRTLVLGGTMCGGPKATPPPPSTIQHFITVARMPVQQAIEHGMRLLYTDGFIGSNRAWLVKRALENAHLMPPPYALQRQVMAVLSFNTQERLHEIHVPSLVITGTEDKIVPSPNSRVLAERIADARLIEFEGAGHGFLVERAEETNRVVLGFLEPHRTHFVAKPAAG